MITWMQRHRKYLIITIWISTIAFVGAGFVGWGQYSYGDKAGAVAKVGSVEITMGELQKSYSSLYAQYNELFKGNFDEEKAKSFGLKAQALQQLTNQALILNLAKSYDLAISDKELIAELKTQKYFFKNGVFDKDTYKQVLSMNKLSLKEYETNLKKELLIRKTLKLLPVSKDQSEVNIINTIENIADKINYKVINNKQIEIDSSDKELKSFWEGKKSNFMTDVSYEVRYVTQPKVKKDYSEDKISTYYKENRTHFKGKDGKILPLNDAKKQIIDELNDKSTKDTALRTYISYKKGKLKSDTKIKTAIVSESNNPFTKESIDKITKLSLVSPFMKPVKVGEEYLIFELIKINPSKTKGFNEVKAELLPIFMAEKQKEKLLKLAEDSVSTFNGKTTDFITSSDALMLKGLTLDQANSFLQQLFMSQNKKGFINLNDGNIVLYSILEQKLLSNKKDSNNDSVAKLKSSMFNEGLIKNLQNRYKTEIFIEGL